MQIYAERPDSAVERPVRWLVGSAVVRADAGEEGVAAVAVRRRELAHWDDGWRLEPGAYRLRIGTSVVDLMGEAEVVV